MDTPGADGPRYIDLERFTVAVEFRGRSKFIVQLWWLVQSFLIAPSPQFLYGWRRFLWRLFGAQVGRNVLIRPTAKAQFPWKVRIGDNSWIGDNVDLYSLGDITIGANAVVSQYTHVCAGTHDYLSIDFPLVARPIVIEDETWICSGCFIAPGVTIGRGAIVAARSVVISDMPPVMICAGSPARPIKDRPLPRG